MNNRNLKKVFAAAEDSVWNETIENRERRMQDKMDENGLLYEKILQYLKDKIGKQELLPGDRLPTEMELAEEFGVSRITSKRALEELRSAGLIYRVRGRGSFVAAPQYWDGESDKAGKGLDYGKVIAFMIPFPNVGGGVIDVIKGVSRIVSEKGYILDIKYSNNDLGEERRLLQTLYERGVGGIIFYPISGRKNLEIMNILSMNEYPVVSIDRYFEGMPVSYVMSDNLKGGYDATKYLLGLGHRKIAFVSDKRMEDYAYVRDRYFGYCKALKEGGIGIHQEFVKNGDLYELQKDSAVEILKDLLGKGVTALCCINDYVAILVLQSLKNMEVNVPKEVSVTGFDNLEVGKATYVPLTTIHRSLERIGETAAEYIVECIESGKYSYMKKIIPVELVERESCGKAGKEKRVFSI